MIKLAAAGIALISLIMIVIVALKMQEPKEKVEDTGNIRYSQTTAKPSQTSPTEKVGQKVTKENVTVQVPINWRSITIPTAEKELIVAAAPNTASAQDIIPRLFIRKTPSSKKSQEKTTSELVRVGFTQEGNATIAGKKAQKFSIMLSGDSFVDANPQKKDVLQNIYVFTEDGYVYQVDLAYYKDNEATKTFETLSQIVASLTML